MKHYLLILILAVTQCLPCPADLALENAANAAAVRAALGVERKNNLGLAVASFRGAVKDLRIVTFGDSLVNNPPLNLASVFSSAGGYCRAEDSLNVSGSSTVDDWTYPGGRQVSLPNGATRRWGVGYVTASAYPFQRASKFRVWYVRGTGTLRLRSAAGGVTNTPGTPNTVFADISGHTAIDTSTGGSAGTIAYRDVTMTNSDYYRIDTVSDAGTIKIIGVEAMEITTGNRDSCRYINLGLGGSSDSSWITTGQTNWTAMLSVINPHIIVFKAADFHITEAGTDWSTTLDRIRTACPTAVMLLVDPHPHSANTSPTTDNSGWSAALKTYAVTNAPLVQFCETRKFWPSYADMLSNGLISGDGIHLTSAGDAFDNVILLDYVATLTAPPERRTDLSTQVGYALSGCSGVTQSRYLNGPTWQTFGDLNNGDGSIGFNNFRATAASTTSGPQFLAYGSNHTNFRVSSGFAFGKTATDHQLIFAGRNNGRAFFGAFGNVASTLQRDPSARVEIGPYDASETPLVVGVVSGQTADALQIKTAITLSSAGTTALAVTAAGSLRFDATGAGITLKSATNGRIGTGVALTAGVATVANTSVTANTQVLLTCTAVGGTPGVRLVVTKSAATSFTITSVNAAGTTETADTSTFDWQLTERQ